MMMKLLKTFDLHSRNQNPKNERKKEREFATWLYLWKC